MNVNVLFTINELISFFSTKKKIPASLSSFTEFTPEAKPDSASRDLHYVVYKATEIKMCVRRTCPAVLVEVVGVGGR